jgi:D-sedoheptulose 7-phosphate isomerase
MTFAEEYRRDLMEVVAGLDLAVLDRIMEVFAKARDEGRTIFVCGNGGSMASASHVVCDIVKGASYGREKRFRMLALHDNLPTVTAYSNDVSYEVVYEEQLKNFAEPGDVVMVMTGSGNSPNVVRALEWGRANGLRTIAMTGRDGGKAGPLAEIHFHVAHPHMGRIEDAHMIACHMIAYRFMERD